MPVTPELIVSLIFLVCSIVVYGVVFKYNNRKLVLKRFHNAIKTACENRSQSASYDDILSQMFADFNSTVNIVGKIQFTSYSDLIDQICCRYNTYSDQDFEAIFDEPKNPQIREFACELRREIEDRNWYIELPSPIANWVHDIKKALELNNSEFGIAALKQLATDIISREHKQKNKKVKIWEVINIISIIASAVASLITLIQAIIS